MEEATCGISLVKEDRETLRIITQDSPFENVAVPILALSANNDLLVSNVSSRVVIPEPDQPFTLSIQNIVRVQGKDLRNYAVILFDMTPELEQYRKNNGLDVADEKPYVPHAILSDQLAASSRQRNYVTNLGSTMYRKELTFHKMMITYRPVFVYTPDMK